MFINEDEAKFTCLEWTKDEKFLMASSYDRKIRIYEMHTLLLHDTFNFPGEGVSWVCFSKLDKLIVAAGP